MTLPAYVRECLDALENAGYAAYVVGGCVRDACLGLIPQDYDVCTAALPQQTRAVFSHRKLVLAGERIRVSVCVEGAKVVWEEATAAWEGNR